MDIAVILVEALQLPNLASELREGVGVQTRRTVAAAAEQTPEAVMLPAMALLTAWLVTVLRSADLEHEADRKFRRAEGDIMVSFLGEVVLASLIKYQQHPLSGVLLILATRFIMKAGHPTDEEVPRHELEKAAKAGLTCVSFRNAAKLPGYQSLQAFNSHFQLCMSSASVSSNLCDFAYMLLQNKAELYGLLKHLPLLQVCSLSCCQSCLVLTTL